MPEEPDFGEIVETELCNEIHLLPKTLPPRSVWIGVE